MVNNEEVSCDISKIKILKLSIVLLVLLILFKILEYQLLGNKKIILKFFFQDSF